MRSRCVAVLALVLFGCGGGSSSSGIEKPLLWSAEKDGKTTFLFGTIHIGIDAQRLPKVVWDKLDASPVLAVEADTSDAAALTLGQRKGGGSLRDDLGPAYWEKLEQQIGDRGVTYGLSSMKPVSAVIVLMLKAFPMVAPMDGEIKRRAQTANKKVEYLEAIAKQVALLEKWLDIRALKQMLDNPDETPTRSKAMIAGYIAGDDAALLATMATPEAELLKAGYTKAEYDEQLRDMFYDRNASWIEPIEKLHAQGGAFVAVGAGHLIGPKSVVELLAAKGYKITRIAP